MSSYFEKKIEQNLPVFFGDITLEILKDSKNVYIGVGIFSILSTLCFFGLTYHNSNFSQDFLSNSIKTTNGLFLLIPPFTLAVVAMFPAFSSETKDALSQSSAGNANRPLGAVFLNEFLFIIFWSLIMLLHNFTSELLLSYKSPSVSAYTLANKYYYSLDIMAGIWLLFTLGLGYEIIHSLKLLYLLILREYYQKTDRTEQS